MISKRSGKLVGCLFGLSLLVSNLSSCSGEVNFQAPTWPGPSTWPSVTVTVSPASATVKAGDSFQFTAQLRNTSQGASWNVNGIPGGNETVGTISNGMYIAPLSPPPSGKVTITAVWVGDRTTSGSATASIVFSDASLSGQYAFSLTTVAQDGSLSFSAGIFQANGNGSLVNGVRDLVRASGVITNSLFTGAYSVGPDGRGTATLTGSNWTWYFSLVVLSNHQARLMLLEPSLNGRGLVEKQDSSAFSNSALGGSFSLVLRGIVNGAPWVSAGRFTANGLGAIYAGLSDINHAGAVATSVPSTGAYNSGAAGRGTLTLTDANGTTLFNLYALSADRFWLLSVDPTAALVGVAERQQPSTFDKATLAGAYIFVDDTAPLLGSPTAALARFIADGAGSVAGTLEEIRPGPGLMSTSFGGSYSISANGRGVLPAENLSFYMVSSTRAFVIDLASTVGRAGIFEAQQGTPFATATLEGRFGLQTSLVAPGGQQFHAQGSLVADSAGNLNGVQDSNGAGLVTERESVTGLHYSVNSDGRGTRTDSSGRVPPVILYFVSPTKYFLLGPGTQPDTVFCGVAERQY